MSRIVKLTVAHRRSPTTTQLLWQTLSWKQNEYPEYPSVRSRRTSSRSNISRSASHEETSLSLDPSMAYRPPRCSRREHLEAGDMEWAVDTRAVSCTTGVWHLRLGSAWRPWAYDGSWSGPRAAKSDKGEISMFNSKTDMQIRRS
jgi:hypothetical protein